MRPLALRHCRRSATLCSVIAIMAAGVALAACGALLFPGTFGSERTQLTSLGGPRHPATLESGRRMAVDVGSSIVAHTSETPGPAHQPRNLVSLAHVGHSDESGMLTSGSRLELVLNFAGPRRQRHYTRHTRDRTNVVHVHLIRIGKAPPGTEGFDRAYGTRIVSPKSSEVIKE